MAAGLQEGKVLRIQYQVPGHTAPVTRLVEPNHLVSYRGEWYLVGYCQNHDEHRTFAISRMKKVEKLPVAVDESEEFDLEKIMGAHFGIIYGDKEHRVKVKFNPDQAPYVKERDWHPTQTITDHKDGSITLEITVNHLYEISRWILSWGSGAKVLEPKELKDMIKAEAKAILEAE